MWCGWIIAWLWVGQLGGVAWLLWRLLLLWVVGAVEGFALGVLCCCFHGGVLFVVVAAFRTLIDEEFRTALPWWRRNHPELRVRIRVPVQ